MISGNVTLIRSSNFTKNLISQKTLSPEVQLLESLYGGQFTLSTPLIKPNFCILLPHRRSTTVSLETTPSFEVKKTSCATPKVTPAERESQIFPILSAKMKSTGPAMPSQKNLNLQQTSSRLAPVNRATLDETANLQFD